MAHTAPNQSLSTSYKVLRVLSRSLDAETMLALDRRTGVEVVVKAVDLDLLSAGARSRLEHQGWLLRDSSQSGVAGVIDTLHDDERLYVVMPYVHGITLRHRLDVAALGVPDSLLVLRSVLASLARIHAGGDLHRDVRPSNIVVDDDGPLRRATLVDFGLASSAYLTGDCAEQQSDGVRYMAPEVAGVLDRQVDGRSDLYSAGIVLFECLVGHPPFESTDVQEILRHQLSTAPPELRTLGIPVPQALEEILRRLLRKDPDDRYRSAEAALADVEQLVSALRRGVVEPGVAVGAQDTRETLTEPRLVGRASELAFLHRRFADASRGVAGTVVLEANSGGGKTRVLGEFCQRAITAGARVLRGRGTERAEQRPLEILDGIVDDLVDQASADPVLLQDLSDRVGDAANVLCEVLPELRRVLDGGASARSGSNAADGAGGARSASESIGRVRVVSSIVALLDALGTPERTVILAIDDCQWADELTLQVLEAWADYCRQGESASPYLLVVAATRLEEEFDTHRRLTAIVGAERLPLPALDADQVAQVVESMAGKVPEEATKVVLELSRGNPLMVSAVLRGLVEINALSATGRGWSLDAVSGGWQASRESAGFLARRFAVLDSETRRLLDAGAVLGRDFDLTLAASLVDQRGEDAERAVEQAIERHLVWSSGEGRYSFAHDKLRAGLLDALEGTELARLHRRAAESIELADRTRAFDLAFHFDAAGDHDRALGYALQSAVAARARHDYELAERQYRIAERGMNKSPMDTQYSIAEGLGQILTLRGRYDDATERFERARSLAQDKMRIAWIDGQLGELLFRRDDLEGAAALLESGLRVLGERIPAGGPCQLILRLTREVLSRFARKALRLGGPDTNGRDQRVDRLKAHLYTRLLYPRWFHANRLQNLCLLMRQINVSERSPEGVERAHGYTIWGPALALTFPFTWRHGLRYVDMGEHLYRQKGDIRGQGHVASMRACVLHAAGRYQEAIASADAAIQTLAKFGDRWELGFAARTRAVCLYRLGRLREAREEARRVIDIGLEVSDANAQVTGLEVLAKATGGQVSVVQTRDALSRLGDDIEVTAAALQAEALRLRQSGQLGDAIVHLENAVRAVRRAKPTSTHLVPVFAWLATLQREHAEKPLLPHVRRRRIRCARRSARRAVRYARLYPNEQPHALREIGVVSALAGRRRAARRYLDRSAERAERREAWAELMETNLQRARLGFEPARLSPGAEVALGAVAERPEPPTLGMAARSVALLDAGVLLASTDSRAAIEQAIRQIARSLLRADRCRVVGLTREWSLDTATLTTHEREVARRAADEGRPIILSDPLDVDPDSGADYARSALCAPVFVRGELAGYFLALHSQVHELFGAEEQQLAEFVARLAGAALESQHFHHESRARVIAAQEAERTRVARDLHDEIGQALTSVLLGVRLVESAVRSNEPIGNSVDGVLLRTAELRETAAFALNSVQRLAFDLRPAVLDDLGLVAAVRRLTASAVTGDIEVELETVDLESGARLPAEIETMAYRIAQEGISNVVRHAQASKGVVIIGRARQRLRVVVEDDGVGFDPAGCTRGGLGLLGMRERAALVGGSLRVRSAPGSGTSVVFEVHLDQ